jgi:RHS repeat-associated protein
VNGYSVFDYTYDAIGRKTACAITLATGVVGTTAQAAEFDGLSRITFGRNSISTAHADVSRFYDSLDRILEDSQTFSGNTRNVTNEMFESFPMTQFAFPNGRQTTNQYDLLYRRTDVKETSGGANIAKWSFFGPGRVAECELGNGLICSHLNNARTRSASQAGQSNPGWGGQSSDRLGFDGAGRMITKRYLAGGINGGTGAYDDPTSVVGQTTAYDHSSNKFYERALHAESRSSLYEPFDADHRPTGGYDSINRLRQYQRGVLSDGSSGAVAGGSVTTPISLPNTDESRDYVLDGLGNWRRTTFDPVGGAETTQVRQHNGLNEITRTDDGTTQTDFEYDGATGASNGNLQDDGIRTYQWDALNRLVEVKRKSDDATIGEYTYDIFNRRIRKVVSNGGLSGTIPNGTTDFIYNSDWQCVEERDGSNSVFKQYVWGRYIDELLQMKTATVINGNAAGEYYPLCEILYNMTALTDSAGAIVEAYDTDAYGNKLIFVDPGTGANWFADDAVTGDNPTCEFIFTSRRYDPEKQTDQFRNREYDPVTGRFPSKDPIGYADGMNPYRAYFVPASVDPFGLDDPRMHMGPQELCDYNNRMTPWYLDVDQRKRVLEEIRSQLPAGGAPFFLVYSDPTAAAAINIAQGRDVTVALTPPVQWWMEDRRVHHQFFPTTNESYIYPQDVDYLIQENEKATHRGMIVSGALETGVVYGAIGLMGMRSPTPPRMNLPRLGAERCQTSKPASTASYEPATPSTAPRISFPWNWFRAKFTTQAPRGEWWPKDHVLGRPSEWHPKFLPGAGGKHGSLPHQGGSSTTASDLHLKGS